MEPPARSVGVVQPSVVEALPVVALKEIGALAVPTGVAKTDEGVPNDAMPPTTYIGVSRNS